MINSIELKNWKTHANTKINFRKGTNVIVGIMGAGKSSIMDAISFALFGTFPALKQNRTNLSNIVMNRPEEKEEAEVRLSFTINGNKYVSIRKIGKSSGSSATLEKNGSYLQTQPKRVNEEIKKILGLDYDTFSRAIYAEQNRLDYILELRKGERKKQIDEMLNLDRFSIAEENATSLINTIRNSIADEEQMLTSIDVTSLKKQLEKLSAEKAETEHNIVELEVKTKEKKKVISLQKNKLEIEKKAYEKRKKLEEDVNKIIGRIEAIKKEIEKINHMEIDEQGISASVTETKKNIEIISKELESMMKKEKEEERKIGEIASLIVQFEKRLIEKEKLSKEIEGLDVKVLANEVSKKTEELRGVIEEIAGLNNKKKEEEKWMLELSKHLSTCPLCKRELSEELRKKLLDERKKAITQIDKRIKELNKYKSKLEEEAKDKADTKSKVEKTLERLKNFEGIEENLEKEKNRERERKEVIRVISREVEEKSKKLEELKELYNELKTKLEYTSRKKAYEKELEEDNKKLKSIKEEFISIKVDEKRLYALQDLLLKESAELSELSSKLQSEKKYLENVASQAEEKVKEIAKFEVMKEGIEERRVLVADLNKFKSSLIDTEKLLRGDLIRSVNALMQSIWPKLYPYGDYTSLRLKAAKDDYILEINATQEGRENWLEIENVASGGERSIAALVLRIALSIAIVPNLKWIILDEPTHNLDRAGISKLIEVLGGTLPKVVEQVFIITHDESMKEINPASIYILERDKANNEPTIVKELA